MIKCRARAQAKEMENPFITVFEKKKRKTKRWDFRYVSEDFEYSDDDEIITGLKLDCKYLDRAEYKIHGKYQQLENILMIKDIGIDMARARRGYFSEFIRYLIRFYEVIVLENVTPEWLKQKLDANQLWSRQTDTNTFVLISAEAKDVDPICTQCKKGMSGKYFMEAITPYRLFCGAQCQRQFYA